MNESSTIRVLHDPPLDGPTNMARDEALLVLVGQGQSPPTLRLYQWDPPTISLGYFQRFADYEALPSPAGALAVVRRLTGGGAILHDLELTYSLTLPIDHPLMAAGPNRLYELAHDAVIATMAELGLAAARCGVSDDSGAARGPFFCFERRHCYDVLLGADKLAGSAQRRTRHAILQHGSVILGNRFEQQATAALPWPFEETIGRLRSALTTHASRIFSCTMKRGLWADGELANARSLVDKYAGRPWTLKT